MLVWILRLSFLLRLPLGFWVWAAGVSGSSSPAPELVQVPETGPAVALQCRAPPGHSGLLFQLFHVHELVDSVQYDTHHSQAEFVLQGDAVQPGTLYCCQYENSMFSPYTRIKAPPRPITPPGPPHLSVEPPDGRVLPGQMLTFQCQSPSSSPSPVSFLLLKQLGGSQEPATQQSHVVSQSISPQFWVGPVGQNEEGFYTCLYQLSMQGGVQNSTLSSPVCITLAVHLPVPRLSEEEEGVLVCTGSPLYPRARFSLFPLGASSPVVTHTASVINHSVRFTASELQREGSGYQCQYSVQLGKEWAHSERSAPLVMSCTTGSPSCSLFPKDNIHPHAAGRVDLALVIGSISAALLFLLVLIILGFAIYKNVKAAARKKKQREEDLFWKSLQSENHVDLILPRVSISTMEFGAENESCSAPEPIYDYPVSTFTKPYN